eukprot:48352-Eustigmatos_ZCMA.PRE.2
MTKSCTCETYLVVKVRLNAAKLDVNHVHIERGYTALGWGTTSAKRKKQLNTLLTAIPLLQSQSHTYLEAMQESINLTKEEDAQARIARGPRAGAAYAHNTFSV